jgi:hypothetical protein
MTEFIKDDIKSESFSFFNESLSGQNKIRKISLKKK